MAAEEGSQQEGYLLEQCILECMEEAGAHGHQQQKGRQVLGGGCLQLGPRWEVRSHRALVGRVGVGPVVQLSG